jgi:hypothetical protein
MGVPEIVTVGAVPLACDGAEVGEVADVDVLDAGIVLDVGAVLDADVVVDADVLAALEGTADGISVVAVVSEPLELTAGVSEVCC